MRNRFRAEREFHHEAIDWNVYRWEHLIESSEFTTAKVIASYISYGTEPETHDINCKVLAAQKTLLLPRMMPDKNLEWVQWDGNQESLTSNGRIHEPLGEAFTSESDLILVPALHVDRQGNRLGQGGGSYDRALSGTHAYTIALVYAGELTSEEIPVEPHDVKMKAVATPELLVRFTARN